MNEISFSQASDGYLLHAHSRRLSEHTLADYGCTFRRFQRFLAPGDLAIAEISLELIERFFADLSGLSEKAVVNYHTGLSALWTWALERRMVDEHVVKQFERPKPTKKMMEIFSEAGVQRLLDACDRTPACSRRGKRKCGREIMVRVPLIEPLRDAAWAVVAHLRDGADHDT